MTPEEKRERARIAKIAWRRANPEQDRANQKRYQEKNREIILERRRQDRKNNPAKYKAYYKRAEAKRRQGEDGWKYSIWRRYRLKPEEYLQLFNIQGGLCAACKGQPDKFGKLCVDHIVKDNLIIIRGLLCDACNKTLGLVGDDPEKLFNLATKYIPWIQKLANGETERPLKKLYTTSKPKKLRAELVNIVGSKCMSCGCNDEELVLDHDHSTGWIRGLLCRGENAALGHAKENPAWLLNLRTYLVNNKPAFIKSKSRA